MKTREKKENSNYFPKKKIVNTVLMLGVKNKPVKPNQEKKSN